MKKSFLSMTAVSLLALCSGTAQSADTQTSIRQELDAKTLRIYPSAHLPPVSDPYYFLLFSGSATKHPFSVINMMYCVHKEARPEQGILPLSWHYGPQMPVKTEKAFLDSYLRQARRYLGTQVDEWQGFTRAGEKITAEEDPNRVLNNNKITWSINAILAAKKANPAFFILVYWRSEDSILPLLEKGEPDLLVPEGQSHLSKKFRRNMGIRFDGFRKRLDYARKIGVLEKTIPLYGFFENKEDYHPGGVLTIDEVEKWIRVSRTKYPEMPGIAFYGSRNTVKNGTYAAELLQKAEALCWKYYIEPAPALRILSPAFESAVTEKTTTVKAEALPKDGRTIIRYRFFVDNRLMAESEKGEYTIENRLFGAGRHIVTVHAIDSNWNRAAAQLPFTIAPAACAGK